MAQIPFKYMSILRQLEDDCFLAEPLLFPGLSRFGSSKKSLLKKVESCVKTNLTNGPLLDIHRHELVTATSLKTVDIEVEPPVHVEWWRQPITLKFHVIIFESGGSYVRAYIPTLGIEVLATSDEELEEQLPSEIRFALARMKALTSLPELVHLARCRKVVTSDVETSLAPKSPTQRAQAELTPEVEDTVLNEVADLLITLDLPPAYEAESAVNRLAEALAPGKGQSVLLVGPSGVGKTAIFNEVVNNRQRFGLAECDFWSTCGSRLIAGQTGFGMWEERCRQIVDEVAKRRAILHLGNLVELVEVGRSINSNLGVASFLRPFIERGVIKTVAECTKEELAIIDRLHPQIGRIFYKIVLEPPSREEGRLILLQSSLASQSKLPSPKPSDDIDDIDDIDDDGDDEDGVWRSKELSENSKETIDYLQLVGGDDGPLTLEAIETIDRLHDRFAAYSAYPGRPLLFLRNLLRDKEQQFMEERKLNANTFLQITAKEVTKAFAKQTGLPTFMVDDEATLDIEGTKSWFRKRVIGQEEAVSLVTDMIAMTKADLGRPHKPLSSFLFIGPTGVGKTEMAKTLAEFLFGSRERLSRFDMSEYSSPHSVKRLIGGVFDSEGLLTSKVREQPFSVLLFDEIEKAHPLFFDMLLQILGEGRLTDAGGRLASFCSSVIIMTSNLGAEEVRKTVLGFGEEVNRDKESQFVEEVRSFFRPELFNRIEKVVPFAHLSVSTTRRIAHREIECIRRLDGILHGPLQLDIDDEAINWLGEKGYDETYGARPLKRFIEETLLTPLATIVNSDESGEVLNGRIRMEDEELLFDVVPLVDDEGLRHRFAFDELSLNVVSKGCARLRRQVHKAEDSPVIRHLANEVFRLEKVKERIRRRNLKGRRLSPQDGRAQKELARLPDLKATQKRFIDMKCNIDDLEEQTLISLYRRVEDEKEEARLRRRLLDCENLWQTLKLDLYCRQLSHPNNVTIALYSRSDVHCRLLAKTYLQVAERLHAKLKVAWLEHHVDKNKQDIVKLMPLEKETKSIAKLISAIPEDHVGIILALEGPTIAAYFQQESGLHEFRGERLGKDVLVFAKDQELIEFQIPKGVWHKGFVKSADRRRVYRKSSLQLDDLALKEKYKWTGDQMAEAMEEAITTLLRKRVNDRLGLVVT